MTEDETTGWHHRLDGDGQGSWDCYNPCSPKESDMEKRGLVFVKCPKQVFLLSKEQKYRRLSSRQPVVRNVVNVTREHSR